MSLHEDVQARLERIRTLWAELKRTRPAARRYSVLVEAIRADSSVYLALLEKQSGIDQTAIVRKEPPRPEDVQRGATVMSHAGHAPAPHTTQATTLVQTPHAIARLERINDLWVELEATRRTSARYEVLIELIHTESVASAGASIGGTILMVDDEESVR